ncbi:leucine-rich repeat domain-containing protein [Nostoc sp.]|uniref:leucine-rich repeat domain-containing protein n=1 Tax=Nostoc sp. TaxID=1180 RepID=UPI002FEF3CC9
MKLTSSIATIFTCALGFYTTQTIAAPLENPKSFIDWCQQKSTLPPQTKHTVEVLLKEAQTQNCKQANQKLTNLTYLNLNFSLISDIKPLSALTNLTYLNLNFNQISDIKPLSALTHVNDLFLNSNQISDIKPLSALTHVVYLSLHSNQISDIKPLSVLTNLTSLSLDSNQISDIKPLSTLTNLTNLTINNNPIAGKICPVKPESICQFD